MSPLTTEFLDAPSRFRPSCAAREKGDREGSFTVLRRRGAPVSPEGLLLAFEVGSASESALESGPVGPAEAAQREAAELFRRGGFERAARHWSEAARLFGAQGETPGQIDSLRGLAQAQQQLGRYDESLESLEVALALARRAADRVREAAILGSLGNAHLAIGDAGRAEQLLDRAVWLAQESGEPELTARMRNDLGNLFAAGRSFDRALGAYRESARRSRDAGALLSEVTALANAAHAGLAAGRAASALEFAQRARELSRKLENTSQKVALLIHLARSFRRLAHLTGEFRTRSLLAAHASLGDAIELGRAMQDHRALSYAFGNLGALYQSEHRLDEALYLTRRALAHAERADAPESIYRWHWQAGRILWAQGQTGPAIASHQRAVDLLEETRQETLSRYGAAEHHFRRAVAPVYLDLVDVLTRASDLVVDPERTTALLIRARSTVEQLKAAELRDYYRDECVAELRARSIRLDDVARSAAVIYPIPLADRTELLVRLPSGIARYGVPVGQARLSEVAYELRRTLSGVSRAYLRPARQLYDWLVRPFEAELLAEGIETLVFVPDGALRMVPMAALHDGERFLIERHAVAVTPGLEVVDPRPLDREKLKLLAAGISLPVQGYRALASVPAELETLQSLFGGAVLLDEEFQLARAEQEIREGQPTVLHIASHGEFTGDPATSFLLTYDGRLSMDRLGEVIGGARFRDGPLELLVLSACETAAGNERAALGLAGLAVRAGARSAVGSLWTIDDRATSRLMVSFYRELAGPSPTKAEALRRAQLELLSSGRYEHPRYWSPFLLISNWL
jgi:CHAT domain-containing protein